MSKMVTGLAIVLAVTATQAFAADGQISQSALDAYGLSSLQVVADADGMSVRGQGSKAYVGGRSYSEISGGYSSSSGSTETSNRYRARARNRGTSDASGASDSTSYRLTFRENVAANGNVSSRTRSREFGSFGGASASAR